MIAWFTRSRYVIPVLIVVSILGYTSVRYFKEATPPPEYATGGCTQIVDEISEFPEIGRLLLHPNDCSVYRGVIPAGVILSAPGRYLSVTENHPSFNQEGRGKMADLMTLETAKMQLLNAGWQVDSLNRVTTRGGLDTQPLHLEFRRILTDKTRQYLSLETHIRLKLTLLSLPTPRIDLRLPKAATLLPHIPSASEDRFPELPMFLSFDHQGLSYGNAEQYYTPADTVQDLDAYSWWAPWSMRTYRYDSAKVPSFAAAILYKDALRDAGWEVDNNYNFESMPITGGVKGQLWDGDRELVAIINFRGNEGAYVSFIDVVFHRQVAALIQQWNKTCVANIPGLEFQTGQSNLSDAAQASLERLLEARRIAGTRDEFSHGVMLELRGRADPTGDRSSNLILATERANAVKKWLIAHEVSPESLSVSAYGDWEAGVAEEATPRRSVSVAILGCTTSNAK